MIYGLISDIHGNLDALEAVLRELRGMDGYLCLGDVVGYGAEPGQCLERVRQLPGLICIAGNHDLAAIGRYDVEWFNPLARAAIEWTAAQLSPEEKAYLAALPHTAHADGAFLVHGSLPDEMGYITGPSEARGCFDAMPGDLTFVGHTHVAEYYRAQGKQPFPEQVSLWSGGEVALDGGVRHIVNPGAVGQPRDGNIAASFGVWRVQEGQVEVRRVDYEVEVAQQKVLAAGLPEYLALRLSVGR